MILSVERVKSLDSFFLFCFSAHFIFQPVDDVKEKVYQVTHFQTESERMTMLQISTSGKISV